MLNPGTELGPYKILGLLGSGGMGEVYRAKDQRLGRFVAIKILPERMANSSDALGRFKREATTLASLSHPNIVTIHDFGKEDGILFAVTELLEGQTLKARIAIAPLPWRDACEIAVVIASALSAAHSKGVIHRDLKPANIFLTNDNTVKLLDFGLVRLEPTSSVIDQNISSAMSAETQAGTVLGTIGYMSPEQVRGMPADSRSDIFSLGCVLYEMVAGSAPFSRDSGVDTMAAILKEEPPELSRSGKKVIPQIDTVIVRCLQKDPKKRFQSAEEVIENLKAILDAGTSFHFASRMFHPIRRLFRMPAFTISLLLAITLIAILPRLRDSGERLSPVSANERVVLAVADFNNESGEPELDGLSGMLITSLEQSRHLVVLTRSRMFDVLKQLGKENVDRIDESLGREICRQAKANALVVATIRKFDNLYSIDLKVLDPQKNEYIFGLKEEGQGKSSLPSLLDKLSEQTRSELSEKESEIRTTHEKVGDLTTMNLEAYQHFFLGNQYMDRLKWDSARVELEKAISLDTTFALAYYRLAYADEWLSGEKSAKDPIARAQQYSAKAPQKERLMIQAYSAHVQGKIQESIALYQEVIKQFPQEKEALWMVGDMSFHGADYPNAIRYLQKVLELDPSFERALQHLVWTYESLQQYDRMLEYAKQFVLNAPGEEAYSLLGSAYCLQGKIENALQTYRRELELFPESSHPTIGVGEISILKEDYDAAEQQFKKLTANPSPSAQRDGFRNLAIVYAYEGRYQSVLSACDRTIEIDQKLNDKTDLARAHQEKAYWLIAMRNDRNGAKAEMEKAAQFEDSANFFYHFYLYKNALMIGDYRKASEVAKNQLLYVYPSGEAIVSAYLHRDKGIYDDAVRDFESVTKHGLMFDKDLRGYDLARCYFELNQNDQAVEAIGRMQKAFSFSLPTISFISVLNVYGAAYRATFYARSFYLLGKIYDQKGDRKEASQNYEKVLSLWKHADPDLPELSEIKSRLAQP